MTLGELISYLEKIPAGRKVFIGFHNPHSYRGDYRDLAFEPKLNVTVGDMLKCAREAVGTTYIGWRGGEFKMDLDTEVWIAEEGNSEYVGGAQKIGELLLQYMCEYDY